MFERCRECIGPCRLKWLSMCQGVVSRASCTRSRQFQPTASYYGPHLARQVVAEERGTELSVGQLCQLRPRHSGYEYDATLVAQLGKQKRNSTFPCHCYASTSWLRRRVTKNVAHQRLRAKDVQRLRDLLVGLSLHPSLRALPQRDCNTMRARRRPTSLRLYPQ